MSPGARVHRKRWFTTEWRAYCFGVSRKKCTSHDFVLALFEPFDRIVPGDVKSDLPDDGFTGSVTSHENR